MSRHPLVVALAAAIATSALMPAVAQAEDLLQTYELARTGDPQLSGAEAARLAIREGSVQARAALLPQIAGEATLTRSRNESVHDTLFDPDGAGGPSGAINGSLESESTTRDMGVSVRQMIYDHSNITRLRSANALSRASDFQLESASDTLITRTSAAYFNVLVQLETLAAAEAAESALKKQFDFASKRLEVGLAPITDVHEARATYESARAGVILSRTTVEDAYEALREITGTPVTNIQGLPVDFQPQLPESNGVEQWVQAAIANNPNLKAKEFQVQSAEANVSTARAGHLPTLYLNGGYGDTKRWGSSEFAGIDIPGDGEEHGRGPQLGVTLSVPIFSGGAIQSGVREALARRDLEQDEYEQQKRALERNTRNAYQNLVAGISEVEARRLAVVSAQAAYDASQVGLEVGTRTVLDVLTNQRNLFTASQQYALARYNFLQARLLLEQAAGTLDVNDVQDINRLLTVNAEASVAPKR
ncbi:TolC family outer membrane protein [Agrilutibacter solisilvae]|uniref:TolC family outer membrane protein n=1 Tax=Agrilutibacter solisilvae TaxID=2763317 RepID=A0A974Y2N8_9GAMM|nr:TolC family outer membrane protein [Lysobacter solisilvae]QSX79490.1 TolC family outer membrane protein [Lysobacter solisilvae]